MLDAFLGSGTTVIAAERTGRRCCALELDPGNVPGTQHATDRMCCPEAAELSRRRVADARQCALVKRDMAMRVNEAGQDELARGIDDSVVWGFRPHRAVGIADKGDPVSLDDEELVRNRLAAGSIDQRPVLD